MDELHHAILTSQLWSGSYPALYSRHGDSTELTLAYTLITSDYNLDVQS